MESKVLEHHALVQSRWNSAVQKVARSSFIGCSTFNGVNESKASSAGTAERTATTTTGRHSRDTNDDCDKYFSTPSENAPYNLEYCLRAISRPSLRTFKQLKEVLKTVCDDWIWEFLKNDGLGALFNALHQLGSGKNSLADTFVQLKCVECVKAVMDTKSGLTCMIENKDFTRKFAACEYRTMTSSSFPLLVPNPKSLPMYKYLFEFDCLYHFVRIFKRKFYFEHLDTGE